MSKVIIYPYRNFTQSVSNIFSLLSEGVNKTIETLFNILFFLCFFASRGTQ